MFIPLVSCDNKWRKVRSWLGIMDPNPLHPPSKFFCSSCTPRVILYATIHDAVRSRRRPLRGKLLKRGPFSLSWLGLPEPSWLPPGELAALVEAVKLQQEKKALLFASSIYSSTICMAGFGTYTILLNLTIDTCIAQLTGFLSRFPLWFSLSYKMILSQNSKVSATGCMYVVGET